MDREINVNDIPEEYANKLKELIKEELDNTSEDFVLVKLNIDKNKSYIAYVGLDDNSKLLEKYFVSTN